MNNSSILLPLFLSLIPMVCWGTMDFLGAKLSRSAGELIGLVTFQFIGALMMIPLMVFFPLHLTQTLLYVLLLGIFNTGCWVAFMYAAKVGNISIVGPIGQSGYAIASILGIIFLHETVNLIKILSIIVIFLGITLLSVNWQEIKKLQPEIIYRGAIPAIFAAVDTGITFVLLAPLSRAVGWYYTSLVFRISIALSAFLIIIFCYFLNRKVNINNLNLKNFPYKLASGMALVDIIGFMVYNFAVSHYEVSYVMIIISASSMVTIFLAYIFLREKLRLLQKIGAIAVILGIIGLQLG